jgi:hypothetical protein
MAAARRLSELLQEQQEPFLLEVAYRTRRGIPSCCPRTLLSLCNHGLKKRRTGCLRPALSKVLCCRAVLRWEDLAGGCGGREFRRLRRYSGECAMEFGGRARWKDDDVEVDSPSRQLSPVSVLERCSDDDSPVHSPCKLSLNLLRFTLTQPCGVPLLVSFYHAINLVLRTMMLFSSNCKS